MSAKQIFNSFFLIYSQFFETQPARNVLMVCLQWEKNSLKIWYAGIANEFRGQTNDNRSFDFVLLISDYNAQFGKVQWNRPQIIYDLTNAWILKFLPSCQNNGISLLKNSHMDYRGWFRH